MVVRRLSRGPEVSQWSTQFVTLWKCEVVEARKHSVVIGWEDEKGKEHFESFHRKVMQRGYELREGSRNLRVYRRIYEENTRIRKVIKHPPVPTQEDHDRIVEHYRRNSTT